MQKKQKFYADQRWDKPHYDTMIGFVEEVFQAFNQYGITPNSKVITGWSIIVDSGLTVKVDQTNPSALIISDRVGFENLQWHTSSDTPLTVAVADDDVSYVEVQFTSTTSDSQTIALWDPAAASGAGAEFTQAANTTDEQIATLVTNTIGFSGDADKLPLATVTASSGVITTPIPDSREKLFSAESTFSFGAPETDQEINSFKDMFEAIATVILRDKNALTSSSLTDWFAVPPVLPTIVDPYDKIVGTAAEVISGAATHEWTDAGTQATFFTDLADGDRIFFKPSITHIMKADGDFDHADLKITFDAQAIVDGNDGTQWTLTFSGDRIQVYQGRFIDFTTGDINVTGANCLIKVTEGLLSLFDVTGVGSKVIDENNIFKPIITITASTYTVLAPDNLILVNHSADVTITLPTAVGIDGKELIIKNIMTSFIVTIDGDNTETIDGNLTLILSYENQSVTLRSDGINWEII